jgi:hypothetical protein
MFNRRHTIYDEIDALTKRLAAIIELRLVCETKGWAHIREIFSSFISQNAQEVFDLCSDPDKNARLIRDKHVVAEALTRILATIDSRVREEGLITRQIDEKSNLLEQQQQTEVL